jgi:PEP-CTERM motif-containing protein
MRRVMLTLGLMLWASQVEASIFFTPDEFNLNVKAVFNDTGTDTFCWQCGDANPLNDFQAVLSFPDLIAEPWPPLGFTGFSGLAQLQSTATSYLGLDAPFSLHAKLTAWGHSLPESLVNPSVSFGVIPGRFLGVDGGTALVLECCDGFVDGVEFQQAFFPSTPFIVPPGGLQKSVNLELHPRFLIEYTPASVVPEPTSWLLLGSGFTAAALRRRRAKTDR